MSADETPAAGAAAGPGRRDGRLLPPCRPLPFGVPSNRGPWSPELRPPYPLRRPRPPRPPRPARPWLRTLAIVLVTVLTVCGLMAIAFVVWLALVLNSLSSNK